MMLSGKYPKLLADARTQCVLSKHSHDGLPHHLLITCRAVLKIDRYQLFEDDHGDDESDDNVDNDDDDNNNDDNDR